MLYVSVYLTENSVSNTRSVGQHFFKVWEEPVKAFEVLKAITSLQRLSAPFTPPVEPVGAQFVRNYLQIQWN